MAVGDKSLSPIVSLVAMAAALLLSVIGAWKIVAPFDFISLGATIVGSYPMATEAFEAIRKRRMTMELSISIFERVRSPA